jgi:hypothetical protein
MTSVDGSARIKTAWDVIVREEFGFVNVAFFGADPERGRRVNGEVKGGDGDLVDPDLVRDLVDHDMSRFAEVDDLLFGGRRAKGRETRE